MDWLEFINTQKIQKCDYVIITVVETKGSTPCNVGQKIIYSGCDNFFGSIGGGNLEFNSLKNAKQILNLKIERTELVRYPLGASLGQCCGGYVKVMFESYLYNDKNNEDEYWLNQLNKAVEKKSDYMVITVIDTDLQKQISSSKLVYYKNEKNELILRGAKKVDIDELFKSLGLAKTNEKFTCPVQLNEGDSICIENFAYSQQQAVALFGAGHISRALMPILTQLPITIYWIDDRKAQFDYYEGEKSKINIVCDDMPDAVLDLPKNIYCMIITYSHNLDFEICEQIMLRDSFCYLGVIGSEIKGKQFRDRFINKGLPINLVEKLICPIGVKHKYIKSPVSIAVSIATDLINFLESNKKMLI
jgi:xanthine dehydrogenase accessory factor